MQNVQNADTKRVMNLVDLYRTRVSIESQKAIDLAEEYKRQYDNEIDFAYTLHEQGVEGYCLDIRIPEEDIDEIRANEQLLGYFYKEVAGDDADPDVLSYFLAEKYDPSIFTDEEDSFLKSHFTEMVNYIIETPNNDLQAVEGDDRNDINLLPKEVLNLVKERFIIPTGSKVYNPFTGFAQLACLYKHCSFFCEESYMSFYKRWNAHCDKLRETEHIVESKVDENKLHAWMKVALYANNIEAFMVEEGSIPQNYDAVVSYIPFIPSAIPNLLHVMGDEPSDPDIINKIVSAYQNLANGGKMILIIPTEHLWEKKVISKGEKTVNSLELEAFWKQLIDDNSLVEVIQLPSVMGKSFHKEEHCLVIAEKGCESKYVSFMDARFASQKSDGRFFKQSLDLDALHSMIENGGKEGNSGLRKFVDIPKNKINQSLLVPQVYVLEKPSEYDLPVPLTDLCSLGMFHIFDVKESLPEDTPWVESGDLSETFRGALDISSLQKAGCPNNPEGWKYGNRKLSKFGLFSFGNEYSNEDILISNYRNCRYIDGSKDVVLFKITKEGIVTALINATGKAIAVSPDIHVLNPNPKMDALSLLAIINLPIVYRQICEYEQFGLYGIYGHFGSILVPTDKRIIYDEKNRMGKEKKNYKNRRKELSDQNKKHIDTLCNYQHGMRKHIREMSSAIRRMERYIAKMECSEEAREYLQQRLEKIQNERLYLSDDIERLHEEDDFGKASPLNIYESLSIFENYYGIENISIKCNNEILTKEIADFCKKNIELKKENEKEYNRQLNSVKEQYSQAYVDIAEYNFRKIVKNILDNAKQHGFSTTPDCPYYVHINLQWDDIKKMYRIDFRNNGDPLPEGLTNESFGSNRKYAGKTGGTGIGGYEIAINVEHYGGIYKIAQEGNEVVVSIYLPKSKIYGERD